MPLFNLILVRHGHVADNDCSASTRLLGWTNPPLSNLGRSQAEQLADFLASGPPPTAVYTSPLRRAWATAVSVARAFELRPRRLSALREIYCGSLDGLPLGEVQARYPALWRRNLAQADDDFAWPGGESYCAFRSRVLGALAGLAEAHPGQRIVAVTHAGVITQLLGALHGASAARWDAFRVANGSVTELEWQENGGTSALQRSARIARFSELPVGVTPDRPAYKLGSSRL